MSSKARYTLQVESDYLHVESFGQRSEEASIELWEAISRACAEHDLKKVLLISHRVGMLPASATLGVAKRYSDIVTTEYKFALVFSEEDYPVESAGETIASARGINLKAFTDTDEAIQWLSREQI